MDPVSAAGFASSIITFIDFSCKLVQGSVALYQSATDATAENAKISSIVEDLRHVTNAFVRPQNHRADGQHWQELRRLAVDCNAVSGELMEILESLKRKEGNKTWRSLEAAWKTTRKSKEVAAIEQRLNTYRLQLLLRTNLILSDDQASIKKQLDEMEKSDASFFGQTISELTSVRHAIINLECKLMAEASQSLQIHSDEHQDARALDDLRDELASVVQSLEAIPKRTPADLHVLNRLHYGTLYSRVDSIRAAEFGTFSWFLKEATADSKLERVGCDVEETPQGCDHGEDTDEDDNGGGSQYITDSETKSEATHVKTVNHTVSPKAHEARQTFQMWLTSGNGIFHISGKAGSGKSTLMKLLCHDQKLKDRLSVWAGDKTLVFASFFFWASGNDHQRSLEGLYRSLLFEILSQCPDLAMTAFPDFWRAAQSPYAERAVWNQAPFRLPELRQAMENLIRCRPRHQRHRFCFFVDGLDEFHGDSNEHWELARLLRRWTKSSDVKLCVSSRPHQEYLDVFDARQRLHLHELTEDDIRCFVSEALRQEPADHVDPGFLDRAASEISSNAQGVFLWARLVVRSLLEGIRRHDSPRELEERMCQAPGDIQALFRQLFDGIAPDDRLRSDQMLLLAATYDDVPLIIFSWLEDLDNPAFPFEVSVPVYTPDEILRRQTAVAVQFKTLCRGLLEVQENRRPRSCPSKPIRNLFPVFFHKAARDFILQPVVISEMMGRLEGRFDVHGAYHRLLLAHFKSTSIEHRRVRQVARVSTYDPVSFQILSAYSMELDRQRRETLGIIPAAGFASPRVRGIVTEPQEQYDFSFLNILAFYGHRDFVVDQHSKLGEREKDDGLCIIFSACARFFCSSFGAERAVSNAKSLINDLIAAGENMDGMVAADSYGWHGSICRGFDVPAWVAFLHCVATVCTRPAHRPNSHILWTLLELVLGVVPELDIRWEFAEVGYQGDCSEPTQEKAPQAFSITLKDMIMWAKPPNMDLLLREIIRREAGSRWSLFRWAGSRVAPTTTNSTLVRSRYVSGMLFDKDYSIRRVWAGADASWVFPPDVFFRIY